MDVYSIFADYFDQLEPGLGILAGALLKRLDEGHLCLDLKSFKEDNPEEKIPDGILDPGPYLSHDPSVLTPFILYRNNLYFQRYFLYETHIEKKIRQLITEGNRLRDQRIRQLKPFRPLVEELFGENAEAFLPALLDNFCIVTGGPGTGKTTLVREVLRVLYAINPGLKIALAAPTGKAAARINESMTPLREQIPGLPLASTIHRLLESVSGSIFFRHNEDNPLIQDITIVDEASMIDGALMAKLLFAINPEKRLILLGDKDQLASVEAGSVFGDLCKTEGIGSVLDGHVIRLTKSWRFDPQKGIGLFSRSVMEGEPECIVHTINHPDQALAIDTTYDHRLFCEFAVMYRDYIEEPDIAKALEKIGRIRVLCAIREGERGVYQTNRRIAGYLRSIGLPIYPASGFYHNQPVMVTANMYALKVFNGDVGIIRRDPHDPGNRLYAWFPGPDGELLRILPGYLTQWETVFAMTINKSQGSEFDNVLVLLPDNKDVRILTRELLYTAVTRARTRVLVQAPKNVLEETVRKRISRASGLTNRLK
ncbi:MAG: exodeoxyribonuclease V subunit alpha [Bacteroidales bacterium]|jgi:exodeoxyribonuclease V alpha subunit|nr:exodeoxyribonuclease V subunit alpha [Bacteroidales bacterium]NLH23436.1 exodeoxyribonuclease V subunit alpha [Bacteroidales bacterium]